LLVLFGRPRSGFGFPPEPREVEWRDEGYLSVARFGFPPEPREVESHDGR
jgi:hypothetical protein